MSNSPICPCSGSQEPLTIFNPPGRDRINYRVGDFISFRHALLRARAGETELTNWRPGASGDLAVQMVEWWAYLADILTFYNERIANQDYLRTADLPESVKGLILLLGYRPRPGIGATGTLAALLSGPKPITLPLGFQIQSKPGPGKQPQVFELGTITLVESPDAISADPVPSPLLLGSGGTSVLLRGVITSIKPGDNLLLLEKGWSGTDRNYAVLTVKSASQEKDPRGNVNTRVVFAEAADQLLTADASDYRLLKSTQSAHVWQYSAAQVIQSNQVDLERITRGIKVGDPVLFEVGSALATRGIYFSPDGKNLGGGGSTVSVGGPDRTVTTMIVYKSGVITVFDDGNVYYSPDGQNLGGGGNTITAFSGPPNVVAMIVYNGRVLTAFDDGTIYSSPDGTNLGGGGSTAQVYGGPIKVATLLAFQTGVIAAFDDGNIFYTSNGTNLYGVSSTTQQLTSATPTFPPGLMVAYGPNQVISMFRDAPQTLIYLSNGLNLLSQQVFSEGHVFAQAIVPYGAAGVITAIFAPPVGVTGQTTIYNSPDGQNLTTVPSNTTVVYQGPDQVLEMIAFGAGVITAFDDNTVYLSPDGKNLKGGGATIQVYGSVPPPVALLALQNGVLAAFPAPQLALVSVTSYNEVVWFANPAGTDPTKPPTGSPPPFVIAIPHTNIGFKPAITIPDTQSVRATTLVQSSWLDVGTLIATPSVNLTGTKLSLQTPLPPALLPMTDRNVLLSDKNGNGVEAGGTAGTSDPFTIGLSNAGGPTDSSWTSMLSSLDLATPLSVLFDLLPVSRGKTVSNEVLGSGDATVAGQEFVLQKSPLTYLQSGDSTSGSGYKSTLKVWVDGVQWKEVPSFYGQPPSAHIFVTREDENNKTHVQFGDGVNGARLTSGLNNVVAAYRYGSGKDAPDAGSLTVILQPKPGLKAIVNPVPVGGGADPDPPDQIRKYAPQSVLNFGRAVSGNDYETIAAQAPGVARARSYWIWDAAQQRTVVTVYVGDDQNAVQAAQLALKGADDPNRPVVVSLASTVPVSLSFSLVVDPNYVAADVKAAVTAALIDPDAGLFGANVIGIGQVIFESQIYEACLSVPGAVAVHALSFSTFSGLIFFRQFGSLTRFLPVSAFFAQPKAAPFRFDPGVRGFFQLPSSGLTISIEVASNG